MVIAERKAWYDKYGEYGLKEGLEEADGSKDRSLLNGEFVGRVGGYRYAGNSYEIFDKFFGYTNPFTDTLEDGGRDQYGSMFGDSFGGANMALPPKPEDIMITLDCTLQEFYNGCLKQIAFER